jgi:hypothetical protein
LQCSCHLTNESTETTGDSAGFKTKALGKVNFS